MEKSEGPKLSPNGTLEAGPYYLVEKKFFPSQFLYLWDSFLDTIYMRFGVWRNKDSGIIIFSPSRNFSSILDLDFL